MKGKKGAIQSEKGQAGRSALLKLSGGNSALCISMLFLIICNMDINFGVISFNRSKNLNYIKNIGKNVTTAPPSKLCLQKLHTSQLWKEKITEILLMTFSGSVWSSKQSQAFKLQTKRCMENKNLFYSNKMQI